MGIRQEGIGVIYKITSPSNKIYIGQTIDVKTRKNKYKNAACKNQVRLYNSIKKYGWDNHVFEIVEEVEYTSLSEREIFYINHYNSFIKGLNCTTGGEGAAGRVITEETRIKMSKSASGRKQSEETIKKRVVKLKGQKRTDDFKQKLSIIKQGRKLSDETKEKIRLVNLGKQTPISVHCKLIDLETNDWWEAPSLIKLSKICPISLSTLTRIKAGKITKNTIKYKLEYGK